MTQCCDPGELGILRFCGPCWTGHLAPQGWLRSAWRNRVGGSPGTHLQKDFDRGPRHLLAAGWRGPLPSRGKGGGGLPPAPVSKKHAFDRGPKFVRHLRPPSPCPLFLQSVRIAYGTAFRAANLPTGEVGILPGWLAAIHLAKLVYLRCIRKPKQDNSLVNLGQCQRSMSVTISPARWPPDIGRRRP
jgi:hypothetical protein